MFKTVLFDVDGVLLSEERYFDASALTVWELLCSNNYLGLDPSKFKTNYNDNEIVAIRSDVFEHDRVLKLLKSGGLNANWDMIYITFSYQLIRLLEQIKEEQVNIEKWLSSPIDRFVLQEIGKSLRSKEVELNFVEFLSDFESAERSKHGLFSHLDRLVEEKLGVQYSVLSRKGSLWSTCEHVSQEWYVGDTYIMQSTGRPSVQTGKAGFLADEKILARADDIAQLFESLKTAGIEIGIGTGRPELETIEPFRYLGWLKYFDTNCIVTADDVLNAEREITEVSALSKPHPFTYLLALSKKKKSTKECIEEVMPIAHGSEVLIVGDSLADLIAARKMGCTFAAVLTGLSGHDAREEFEEHEADFILDSVIDIKNLVLSINK